MATVIDEGYAKPNDPVFKEPFGIHTVPAWIAARALTRHGKQAENGDIADDNANVVTSAAHDDNDGIPQDDETLNDAPDEVWLDAPSPSFTAEDFRAHWATICQYLSPKEQPETRRRLLEFHGLAESDLDADNGAA